MEANTHTHSSSDVEETCYGLKVAREFNENYQVLSLFSGCGGLDLGLEGGFNVFGKNFPKNPFKVVWSNDINKRATLTQMRNFKNIEVLNEDITKVLSDEVKLPENIDVVVGGFPCQDFSVAGKRGGAISRARKTLFKYGKNYRDTKTKDFSR